MLNNYVPALVFLILGLVMGTLFTFGNVLLGPRRPNETKYDSYECGMPSEITETFRFGISFYLIAMLFILFDVEVLFLYPVAVRLEAFGVFALSETLIFAALLMVGFVYSWRRGALDWE